MSEAKHTEGPWRVSSEIPTAIIADIPQAVDHMKYFGFDDSTPYGGYLIAESVVQPENARLIAAAPEMYNELVIGHGILLKIMDALPLESPEFKRLQKLLINQAEVIVKATGGPAMSQKPENPQGSPPPSRQHLELMRAFDAIPGDDQRRALLKLAQTMGRE